ncbi:hypothetical protein AncyloWKF20_14640 [Ancylobacter sp. WKF20]|uniref:hypothetical protein n=1 Tax=Ancylobacter sp. WKF20 TaxID=3039801 RepID=UPI0024344A0E|nr:hypothetical protein [Ancylobacter sp. WKF20]WGD29019.1 hypothetical protein AncyloWKF20_14640 [Ancylobacter sp. WKF20]
MANELQVSQSHRKLVADLVEGLSFKERVAVHSWAVGLVDVGRSDVSRTKKAWAALSLTLASEIVWPAVKMAARKTKQLGWDQRSRTARAMFAASGIGLAVFGGQNAGLAALGTAVAIPLWVVLGSGAAFANLLIEEIVRRNTDQKLDVKTTYSVIEADLAKLPD